MRQSPAVRVQGQGGPVWRAVVLVLPALAAGSCVAWVGLSLGLSGFWAWVLASKLAALTAAGLAWRPQPCHELAWDGAQWQVDGRPAQVRLMLDLGPWVLAQARPVQARGCVWLPLSAREAGPAWGGLRAALYARPTPAPQPPRPPEHQTP